MSVPWSMRGRGRMSAAERAEQVYALLGDREMTVNELWLAYPPIGHGEPIDGEPVVYRVGQAVIYQAVERLRLTGRVDRRRERGRIDCWGNPWQRAQWVYFRVPSPLSGPIAALEAALAGGEGDG